MDTSTNYQDELTPVSEVVQLICSNMDKFEPLGLHTEHVHAYMVDKDDDSDEEPIVVVSELPRGQHEYGNGIPIEEQRRFSLTFYYPKDYAGQEEGLEQTLRSFLLAHHYYCYSNAGHVLTPDSESITNTLKFNFKKEI